MTEREKLMMLRNDMPATQKVHYLNNGTNGPLPRVVAEAMKHEAEVEFNEGRYLPFISELYKDMDKTRELLAEIVGASYEEIALTQSTTEAINIVLWGINWLPGDEVITTNVDHTAVLAPLAQIKSRRGITVKYVDVKYGEEYDEAAFLEDVRSKITPRTRMLALPHVSFTTGMTFPVKKLVDLFRES